MTITTKGPIALTTEPYLCMVQTYIYSVQDPVAEGEATMQGTIAQPKAKIGAAAKMSLVMLINQF